MEKHNKLRGEWMRKFAVDVFGEEFARQEESAPDFTGWHNYKLFE
jgi:hypothetical protein